MTNCIVIQKSQNGKPYFMILTAENIMPVPLVFILFSKRHTG